MCEANRDFCNKLTAAAKKLYPDIKIFCWTGYELEELNKQYLENIDILITGKFILKERDITLKWRGSRNQKIVELKKEIK